MRCSSTIERTALLGIMSRITYLMLSVGCKPKSQFVTITGVKHNDDGILRVLIRHLSFVFLNEMQGNPMQTHPSLGHQGGGAR